MKMIIGTNKVEKKLQILCNDYTELYALIRNFIQAVAQD